jgi:pimeloyl-ACP methyl ester carboxylesterase
VRRLLVVVVLAATLSACSQGTRSTAVPRGHGTLLNFTRVEGMVRGATSYRIRYASQSRTGKRIEVTGIAVVPNRSTRNRVVLTAAHGTTGLADACAPSRHPESSEASALGSVAVSNNWVLAATDYEGLGTPGRHPYLVGVSEGRSVLDAALAVRQLPRANAGPRTLIAGYSQGGHAALWANELAKQWTPSLRVLGTFAGAPATEIDRILAAGRSYSIQPFILGIVGGYAAAYPKANPARYLTAAGIKRIDVVDTTCLGDLGRLSGAITPERLVVATGPTDPEWQALGRANNPGARTGASPVLIVHSDQDDVVPIELSAVLHDRMCAAGQVVERRVIHAGGHTAAVLSAFLAANAWLKGRVQGEPAQDDCHPASSAA